MVTGLRGIGDKTTVLITHGSVAVTSAEFGTRVTGNPSERIPDMCGCRGITDRMDFGSMGSGDLSTEQATAGSPTRPGTACSRRDTGYPWGRVSDMSGFVATGEGGAGSPVTGAESPGTATTGNVAVS